MTDDVEDVNVDLTAEEQAVIDEGNAADAAAASKTAEDEATAAVAAKGADGGEDDLDKGAPDPVAAALAASTAALEASNRIALENQQRAQDAAKAAADEKARADAAAAEAAKVAPDFKAMRDALREKHETGELDDDDFENQREQLFAQETEWKVTQRAEQIVNDRLKAAEDDRRARDEAALDAAWDKAFEAFKTDPANAEFLSNPTRVNVFNQTLSEVAAEQPTGTFEQWMTAARDKVASAFNIQLTSAQQAADKVRAAEAKRAAEAGRTPTNLNNVPQAAAGGDSKFQNLDTMDISELEDRLALMSDRDREAYLADAPGGLRDHPRGVG